MLGDVAVAEVEVVARDDELALAIAQTLQQLQRRDPFDGRSGGGLAQARQRRLEASAQSVPTELANGHGIQPRIRALDSLDDARFQRILNGVLESILGAFTCARKTGEGAHQSWPRSLNGHFPLPPLQLETPCFYS